MLRVNMKCSRSRCMMSLFWKMVHAIHCNELYTQCQLYKFNWRPSKAIPMVSTLQI